MDTKTPPIVVKHKEKPKSTKQERGAEVFLPPLAVFSSNHRQNHKTLNGTWPRDAPCPVRAQNHKRRPYRVLHIGATPLMHACQQADRSRVLKLLKEQESTIGYRDRTLRSALHYCMDAGTGGAVASAAPELVNAPDTEGHTPLHLAVIAGDTQLVAVLLANGADVNAKDLEGHSVLHWATVCGEVECVRLVLAAGARPSTPDLRGGSPLHYAAQCCGAAATVELSVPKKVGLQVLQTLLEFGADVNAKDEDCRQPILWAASAGSVDAVLALARAGGSAAAGASDKDGLTALHCAASRGHARCIEALVNLCGSQPDHVDDNGCSALHYAATLGHADATALILKLGADPNRQDRKGRTPALCAAAKGQLETLKILAQHGGSIHARTVRGTGVAHEAVASGRIELIKWLARKRPSTLDLATQDGKTPLHVAALHGYLDACKVLLDHDARVNAVLRTSKGNLMTALDAALCRGHRDCAKLIQMHGGTTAQQLKARKITPTKVHAANVRLKCGRSSSDTESSPRREKRGSRYPDLYYEEKWIERRTRRRGSMKKLARRDSRSYSEEEIRSSKISKSERQRRARSESARYNDDERSDRRLKRKRSKRQSTKCKFEYSESSTEFESLDRSETNLGKGETVRTVLRHKIEKQRVMSKEHRDKSSNGVLDHRGTENSDEEERSLSEDSLEVVIMKKSLEKTCEKVVSGRRSKTPKESSREDNERKMKARKQARKKSKAGVSQADDEELSVEQARSSKREDSKADGSTSDVIRKIPVTSDIQSSVNENRYRRDVTDSTSQETVERVIVTAIVHKDQSPDTPKTTLETAKESVTADEQTRKTSAARMKDAKESVRSTKSKMENIIEKADDIHTSLVMKAADLKKDVEEMRHQVAHGQSRSGDENDIITVASDKDQAEQGIGSETEERKVKGEASVEGNLDIVQTTETQNSTASLDSQKKAPRSERRDGSNADKKIDEMTLRSDISAQDVSHDEEIRDKVDLTAVEMDPDTSLEASEQTADTSSASQQTADTSPGSQSKKQGSSETKTEEETEKVHPTSDKVEFTPTTPTQSKLQESDDVKASTSGRQKRKSMKKGVDTQDDGNSLEKSENIETEVPRPSVSERASYKKDLKESSEDKDQSDSAREKSLDFSSESRDSALMEEDDNDGSTGSMTSVASKTHDAVTQGVFQMAEHEERFAEGAKSADVPSTSHLSKQGRPSTGRAVRRGRSSSITKGNASGSGSDDRSAIIAVIENPEWDEEDEEVEKEIRDAIGDELDEDTEPEIDNRAGVVRVLSCTEEEETPRVGPGILRSSVPKPWDASREGRRTHLKAKQRRDSGGRDSGIEPSPRVSRIPRRRTAQCCPNTEKQQALKMETITRDVQISLRRYHLERKIFFQLMELKRLQIRHGRANEHVLVKRQVEVFHRAGMAGPTLGVAKYDQPLTFRHFEAFLYEQLRKLQRRPVTPDFCTEARQCTQKTHRCHHATSAYTSVPVYTYLGGGAPSKSDFLPKIESRGKGQMTVEVTHGEEKQVIALPAERLDRTKRYFVTFTVRGESQESVEKPKSSGTTRNQRHAKSV